MIKMKFNGKNNPNWKGGKVKSICGKCKIEFFIKPAYIKKGRGKFCSKKCYNKWQEKKVTIICKWCGKEEKVKPSRIKKGYGKFCSISCKGKAMQGKNNHNWKEKIVIICKYCKKEKEIFPCGTKRGRGKFCTRECYSKWQSINCKGKNHPSWQGGITPERNKEKSKIWRKAVFERDNYRCLICGKVGGCLNAHHIKNWAGHPKLRYCIDNGMTMCQDCHKTVDKELPLFSIKNRKRKEIING